MNLNVILYNQDDIKNIIGCHNVNLKALEQLFECSIDIHGDTIITNLEDESKIERLNEIFDLLLKMSQNHFNISPRDILYVNNVIAEGNVEKYLDFLNKRKPICRTHHGKPIYAKTLKQDEYVGALKNKDLIFSIGAAGTGKTYLAVCYAVNELKSGNIEKIILTRPAVEAGESLGFLPGDLKEKVDPYLRPLYDALHDMLGVEQTQSLIDKQVIEIAPLAYMRGRTLENAFIILDEAQNATIDQLKMFLTRMGFNSKMVVTGDISQIDLPNSKKSGLKVSANLLKDLDEVEVIVFEKYDVVRHPLVGKIIEKFESLEN
ncbi:MAG: PhoH family protein [Acholeplasmatales bacterium]|nr:PhoH family protein [Acholeplasmatales bacterium]MBQ6782658.1 PhoH family protein [Acholeplasmatales bacterium]